MKIRIEFGFGLDRMSLDFGLIFGFGLYFGFGLIRIEIGFGPFSQFSQKFMKSIIDENLLTIKKMKTS